MRKKLKSPFRILLSTLLAGAIAWAPAQADELELILQAGHTQQVVDSVWLDDHFLCSGSSDGSIKLWHAPSQKVKRTLWLPKTDGEVLAVTDLIASQEGLWAAYQNGRIVLWEPKAGKILREHQLPEGSWGSYKIELDSKGNLYAFDRELYRISLEGSQTQIPAGGIVSQLRVAEDGRISAVVSDKLVPDLKAPDSPLPETFANRWGVESILLNPEGSKLYLSTDPGWIEAWDLETRKLLFRKPIGPDPYSEETLRSSGYGGADHSLLLVDYDAKHFLAKVDQTGQLFLVDKTNGDHSEWGKVEAYGLTRLELSPSKQSLVGGYGFYGGGGKTSTVVIQKTLQGTKTLPMGAKSMFFPDLQKEDGRLFMASSLGGIVSFDLSSGQPHRRFESGYFSKMKVLNGQLFCGGNDGNLHCYDVSSGKEHWSRDLTSSRARFGYGIRALAAHPSMPLVAASVSENYPEVALLDSTNGEVVATLREGAHNLIFSPDGQQLFLQKGKEVKLYDLGYRKILHSWTLQNFRGQGIVALLNHPLDGQLLAIDRGGTIYKIDRRRLDLKPEKVQIRGLPNIISADVMGSKLLVNAGQHTYLCDLSGKVVKSYGQHLSNVVDSLSIGDTILTSGGDSRVGVWDRVSGQKQGTLLALGPDFQDWLVTTPDYHFDGSQGAQDLLEWRWNDELYQVSRFYERFYQPGLLSHVLRSKQRSPEAEEKTPIIGSKPPKVTLREPKELGQGEYEVDLAIEGEHSGWNDVRLYHNGHRVPGKPPYRIKAVTGKNRLRASAFNTDKTVESLPSRLTFETKIPEQKSTLYIFAAAVNDYPNPLDFAVPDAKSFTEAFEPGLHDKVEKVVLLDKDATKEGILEKLSSIDCKPQDTLLVFLAGHGTIIDDRFHYLPFGSDGATSDKALSSQELGQILAKLPATRQVLFLDTCHAGASAKDLADLLVEKDSPLLSSRKGSQFIKDQKLLARQAGTFLVAGSSPNATAAEVPQLGHGIFTYAVLSGLKDKSTTEDQQITVNELLSYLNEKVPELSLKFRGSPHGIWQFSAGQDFPIAKP